MSIARSPLCGFSFIGKLFRAGRGSAQGSFSLFGLSISFLNLFVARDAGLFKKYGVEPELVQMAGPLPVAALASGEIDYLTGYTTGIADAVSHQWPSR